MPSSIRAAFVVLAAAGGFGVVLYGVAWLVMASAGNDDAAPVVERDAQRWSGAGRRRRAGRGRICCSGRGARTSASTAVSRGPCGSWVSACSSPGIGESSACSSTAVATHSCACSPGVLLVGEVLIGLIALNLDLGAARDTLLLLRRGRAGARARRGARDRRARTRPRRRAPAACADGGTGAGRGAPPRLGAPDARARPALRRRPGPDARRSRVGRSGSSAPGSTARTDDARAGTVRAELERRLRRGRGSCTSVPVEVVVVGDAPVDDRVSRGWCRRRARGDGQRREALGRRSRRRLRRGRRPTVQVFVRDTGRRLRPGCCPRRPARAAGLGGRPGGARRRPAAVTSRPSARERRSSCASQEARVMLRVVARRRPRARARGRPHRACRAHRRRRRGRRRARGGRRDRADAPGRRSARRSPPGGRRPGRDRRSRSSAASRHGFLALSVSDAAEDVIGVIRAGARGYVTKAISGDELVARDRARRCRRRGVLAAARRLRPRCVRGRAAARRPTRARPAHAREREVMRLLARGYAYKEIARRLSISIKTVETHASAVLRKLQLSSRNELASWAARRRLL